MESCHITQLARAAGLSRSTLLHYDRIGLLSPSGRTLAGYRVYSPGDRRRLERICQYRAAGLALADIKILLQARGKPNAKVLEKRLRQASKEIGALRAQQRLLAGLLKRLTGPAPLTPVNKDLWVSMLKAAGVSPDSMNRWHAEFERRAPQGHHEFLASLGLARDEIMRIRTLSAKP